MINFGLKDPVSQLSAFMINLVSQLSLNEWANCNYIISNEKESAVCGTFSLMFFERSCCAPTFDQSAYIISEWSSDSFGLWIILMRLRGQLFTVCFMISEWPELCANFSPFLVRRGRRPWPTLEFMINFHSWLLCFKVTVYDFERLKPTFCVYARSFRRWTSSLSFRSLSQLFGLFAAYHLRMIKSQLLFSASQKILKLQFMARSQLFAVYDHLHNLSWTALCCSINLRGRLFANCLQLKSSEPIFCEFMNLNFRGLFSRAALVG